MESDYNSSQERKLTTILAAEVVGYSKMIAVDGVNILEPLKQKRSLIDNVIKENLSSIFWSAGHSLIAYFDSPVRVTESAIQHLKMQE